MAEFVNPGDSEQVIPQVAVNEPLPTGQYDWHGIEESSGFRELVRNKRGFILPATIIFVVYYFGFLILVGYFPDIVETNVFGNVNVAYLLALSQFVLAWILVYLYVRRARVFDRLAAAITDRVKGANR